jgi:hypothetical protein
MKLVDHTFRTAREPGKGRDGKQTTNGLQTHLELIHGYGQRSLRALTVIQLVFRHERMHPRARGHGQ